MDNETIVHFVGFVTNLPPEDFTPLWESHMKRSTASPQKITLHESDADAKGLFKYVSQHEGSSADFRFAFMKESSRPNFPERKARVVQAGGYIPVGFRESPVKTKSVTKIIAFVPMAESALEFYEKQKFQCLNIYQAYFENCAYHLVLEFHVHQTDAPALLAQLKTKPGVEAGVYKDRRHSQPNKKDSAALAS